MRSDAELIGASMDGSREAFGQIVSRYQSLICAVAYSRTGDLALSEDVAQETFLAAWRRLKTLRDGTKLRSWLCAIARNLAVRSVRRRRRDVVAEAAPLGDAAAVQAPGPTPQEKVLTTEEESVLWRALAAVPDGYREPLVLYHRAGRSIGEVARLLDLSEDAVRQRLSRGRRALKAQVATFVEGALARTEPTGAFGVAVIAALAGTSTKTTAATATAGWGIAKVGAMLAGAVAVGVASGVGIRYALQDEPGPASQTPVAAAAGLPDEPADEEPPAVPEPPAEPPAPFLPVGVEVDRFLEPGMDTECLLDLDTGQLFRLSLAKYQAMDKPQEIERRAMMDDWRKAGIDAFSQTTGAEQALTGLDLVALPYDDRAWDNLAFPALVREDVMIHASPATAVAMDGGGQLPSTYAFRTAEGGVGILQITELTKEQPAGVHIRYKILKQGAPAKDTAQAPVEEVEAPRSCGGVSSVPWPSGSWPTIAAPTPVCLSTSTPASYSHRWKRN